jgi:hypothetical protein
VYHQGQTGLYRPAYLFLKSLPLLLLKLTAPIVIETHLTDSYTAESAELLSDICEHLTPVGTHLFRVQTKHGIGIVRITLTDCHDGLTGGEVDGWYEDLGTTSLLGSLHHLVNVVTELLTIQVTMGINIIHS